MPSIDFPKAEILSIIFVQLAPQEMVTFAHFLCSGDCIGHPVQAARKANGTTSAAALLETGDFGLEQPYGFSGSLLLFHQGAVVKRSAVRRDGLTLQRQR